MIFVAKNAFVLQWTLTDPSGAPINNANVVATLYVGRSLTNADNVPGTPVSPLINVALNYVAASAGVYQGSIPATLDPPPTAQSYILTVDASVSGVPVYHTEQPSSVVPFPIDLTTLDAVKDELEIPATNPAQDNTIEQYITAFSQSVLNETGIQSFSIPVLNNETRNGNGNFQMFTRMRPVINVAAVTVSGIAIPLAGVWPSWGYFVADDQKSIWIRQQSNPLGFNSYYPSAQRIPASPGFSRGVGNVQLSYWAGFNNVPSDLERAACRAVAVYYGRKQTRDLASKGLAAGGTTATTRYRDWKTPPEVECVIEFYRRLAVI